MLFHDIIHNTLLESTTIPKHELSNYKTLSLGEDFPHKPHPYYKSAKNNAKKAYDFIKSHKWYNKGVRVCVAPFHPVHQILNSVLDHGIRDYIQAGTKFYFVLVPKSLDKVKQGFANELMDYLWATKAVTNRDFNSTHFVYTDPMDPYAQMGVKEFEPTMDYNIKPKTKQSFGDILSSLDESHVYSAHDLEFKRCAKIPNQAVKTHKNVPALVSKCLKKQIVHLNDGEKMTVHEAGARVVRASKQGKEDDFYILYPYKLVSKYTDMVYFIIRSLLANNVKHAGDMLYGLQINVADAHTQLAPYDKVTDYELMDDYGIKSNKARESFQDIITNITEQASKDELIDYMASGLYVNKDMAESVYKFLRHNPQFKDMGARIMVRKEEFTKNNPQLLHKPNGKNDLYYILLPKKITKTEFKAFHDKLHPFLETDVFYKGKFDRQSYFPAIDLFNIGSVVDFDPLEHYKMKQGTKDKFEDIISGLGEDVQLSFYKTISESSEEEIDKDSLKDYDYLDFKKRKDLATMASIFINNSKFKDLGAFVGEEIYKNTKFATRLYRVFLPKSLKRKGRVEIGNRLSEFIFSKVKRFDPYEGWFIWEDGKNINHPLVRRNTYIKRFDPIEEYNIKGSTRKEFGDVLTGLN
jgi:hypothetical protein